MVMKKDYNIQSIWIDKTRSLPAEPNMTPFPRKIKCKNTPRQSGTWCLVNITTMHQSTPSSQEHRLELLPLKSSAWIFHNLRKMMPWQRERDSIELCNNWWGIICQLQVTQLTSRFIGCVHADTGHYTSVYSIQLSAKKSIAAVKTKIELDLHGDTGVVGNQCLVINDK